MVFHNSVCPMWKISSRMMLNSCLVLQFWSFYNTGLQYWIYGKVESPQLKKVFQFSDNKVNKLSIVCWCAKKTNNTIKPICSADGAGLLRTWGGRFFWQQPESPAAASTWINGLPFLRMKLLCWVHFGLLDSSLRAFFRLRKSFLWDAQKNHVVQSYLIKY